MESLGIEHMVRLFSSFPAPLFLTRAFTGPRRRAVFTPILRPECSSLSSFTSKLPPLQPNARPDSRTETTTPCFFHARSHPRRTPISSRGYLGTSHSPSLHTGGSARVSHINTPRCRP
jgi:hypothetical protein